MDYSDDDEFMITDFPAFTPANYEIKSRKYGDTGYGCMMGTIEFYLPEIDRRVWISCNKNSVFMCEADLLWGESKENFVDDFIGAFSLHECLPKSIPQWLPMVAQTLKYVAEQEVERFGEFALPVAWNIF